MKAIFRKKAGAADQTARQVTALFSILGDMYGPDKLILKAGKLQALDYMNSDRIEEKVLALQKLVYEDPTIDELPPRARIPELLGQIEEEIADILARRSVEEKIEKRISEKMQQRHEEYVKELKVQIVKEDSGPENAQTLKKLALLEKMDTESLSRSVLEVMRPGSLDQVVGQERAINALLAKIASPFPQHVLLYGPPGVGKTTVARLVLEEAKRLPGTPFKETAPFVEVDGTTLRWDPREVTNPLLGSVHDPIYQGARRDLAEGGVPEPKLGLVSEAHGGVLFVDEIGELDPMLQNKLLKVLEEKRVRYDSSYYDPDDPAVPRYIKKLFEEGAPADFLLIGATTRPPEELSPALRSRCAEVYFEPLSPAAIREIVESAAARLGAPMEPGVAEIIAEHTIEGRKAVGILADAHGVSVYKSGKLKAPITRDVVYQAIQANRLSPHASCKASPVPEVGKAFGLGVWGYVGSVLEIEAVAFPAREMGRGTVRFNESAGSMAKDSVFNAASVLRKVLDEDLGDYDVHVNVVGGGKIDGPSAGLAVVVALASAIKGVPVHQDVAVTGEISIQGKVKAVGGIFEKIYGAKQAGMRGVVVPAENRKDVPDDLQGLQVHFVATVEDAFRVLFAGGGGGVVP